LPLILLTVTSSSTVETRNNARFGIVQTVVVSGN